MYNVNVARIEETLKYLEKLLQDMAPIVEKLEGVPEDRVLLLALERMVHISLECLADVGNHMIDGFIMRDPGSYEDIVEILRDEKVIPDEISAPLKNLVNYRRNLITTYTDIQEEDIYQLSKNSLFALKQFPGYVRNYLEKEL
ncbi:MAG TPA: DUF86 domain-containing protein [Paenibacillaceae bacterium]|nr:DUF86 domain-containing protein [Paenibacillaceae bacterium]